MEFPSASLVDGVPTSRQRSLRGRLSDLPLASAVRRAADALFRFTRRDGQANALWCDADRVWMGRETFLYWSLWDVRIDIPWVVACAAGAPEDPDELRETVRAELTAYWARTTASLPQGKGARWHPLP